LRLLSSAANNYNRDYFGETADGSQVPMLNVFQRDGETIRHFWGAEVSFAPANPGQDHRAALWRGGRGAARLRLGLLSPAERRGNRRQTANTSWSASRSSGLAKDAGGSVIELNAT
jgi:hypothetical protein